jgi:hypothetical protein
VLVFTAVKANSDKSNSCPLSVGERSKSKRFLRCTISLEQVMPYGQVLTPLDTMSPLSAIT